ncbi:MAG: hypothetical protein Q8N26_30540 [Myxococcales bacterium]|nr:hypothetical protein [Myxococcales bacterium]
MILSVALVLLSQAPVEPTQPPRELVGAVYLQPVGTVVAASGAILFLSMGTQVRLSEVLLLHADAALVWSSGLNPTISEDFRASTSVSFSAGPQFQLLGTGLKGLFLGPKVYGIYSDNNVRPRGSFIADGPRERWRTGEIGAGVDLSFQWHFGHFFIGSVLGLSVGYALTPSPPNAFLWSTFGGASLWDDPQRGSGVALGMNVHLLRVGFAW